MTMPSSSADLREKIIAAGIKYLPAEQIFYKNFPYKVELSPKFKGLGGVSGKRGCQIDISDPVKGRQKLIEFNELMNKIFSNVEYRKEIREFVERLPKVEYKTRMGGENNLFYFRDPAAVMMIIERYPDVINSVTGPISKEHEGIFSERNTIMRDKLYYGKFRYSLEFRFCEKFAEGPAKTLLDVLHSMDRNTWRANRLETCIKFYELKKQRPSIPSWTMDPIYDKIQLYLTDGNDYIYLKLLAGEFVTSNHELILFSELT